MTDDAVTGAATREDAAFSALTFDPAEFIQFVQDENLTADQASQLLREYWLIAVAFVDLRLGLHSVQHVLDKSLLKQIRLASESRVTLESRDHSRTISQTKVGVSGAKPLEEDS